GVGGGAEGSAVGSGSGRDGLGGDRGREEAGGLCDMARKRCRRHRRIAELSQAAAPRGYAPVSTGGAGEIASDSQWEGGSQRAAGARDETRGSGVCSGANADGRDVSGNLGGSAASGADRRA